MVTMQEAIKVIQQLRGCLESWVEIADEEDLREEDDAALDAAKQFLINAGVKHELET